MNIVPAPLETDVETLELHVRRLSHFYTRFKVDIADGIFVPNTTIQIADISHLHSLAKPALSTDFLSLP